MFIKYYDCILERFVKADKNDSFEDAFSNKV